MSKGSGIKKIYAQFFTQYGVSSRATSTEIVLVDNATSTPAVLGVKILNNQYDLKSEARLIHKSQLEKGLYLRAIGKKENKTSEQHGLRKYIANLPVSKLNRQQIGALNNFVIYGTRSTTKLSWNMRFYLLKSYQSAFGRIPVSAEDWLDLLMIANGQAPSNQKTSRSAWAQGRLNALTKGFSVTDDMTRHALMIVAYGVASPSDQDDQLQKQAQLKYENEFKRKPKNQDDWNQVRAIAYFLFEER
ncbi:hypothetical protein HGA64_04720 [Candidatus Falkowbacteria bacterium]|nr:hypothetical protein [Candidatus Falkowbacteria bacterium]